MFLISPDLPLQTNEETTRENEKGTRNKFQGLVIRVGARVFDPSFRSNVRRFANEEQTLSFFYREKSRFASKSYPLYFFNQNRWLVRLS